MIFFALRNAVHHIWHSPRRASWHCVGLLLDRHWNLKRIYVDMHMIYMYLYKLYGGDSDICISSRGCKFRCLKEFVKDLDPFHPSRPKRESSERINVAVRGSKNVKDYCPSNNSADCDFRKQYSSGAMELLTLACGNAFIASRVAFCSARQIMPSATNGTSTMPNVECETVWQSLCLLLRLLKLGT